jgi:hypothetical protein
MISYCLTTKPAAYALWRMLPIGLLYLREKSGVSKASLYDLVKYLLVTRQAHVTHWVGTDPVLAPGAGVSAPRPSKEELLLHRRIRYREKRNEYMRQYSLAHTEQRKAYSQANKEKIRAKRRELTAAKALVKQLPREEIKTSWIKL